MTQIRGKGQSVCYLCQVRPGTTRDHVPPQCIVTDRTAAQLFTAPCCERCHNANQKDDEYFRNVMAMTADPKAAGPVFEAMKRSFKRSPARKTQILSSTFNLGDRLGLAAEKQPIRRVLVRTAKGILLNKASTYVPRTYTSQVYVNPREFLPDLLSRASILGTIGDDFSYAGIYTQQDPAASIWWMSFYKATGVVVTFAPRSLPLGPRTVRAS